MTADTALRLAEAFGATGAALAQSAERYDVQIAKRDLDKILDGTENRKQAEGGLTAAFCDRRKTV